MQQLSNSRNVYADFRHSSALSFAVGFCEVLRESEWQRMKARIKMHYCSPISNIRAYLLVSINIDGAAYQSGYFFCSDSLRSQASEKVIPPSLHALFETFQ